MNQWPLGRLLKGVSRNDLFPTMCLVFSSQAWEFTFCSQNSAVSLKDALKPDQAVFLQLLTWPLAWTLPDTMIICPSEPVCEFLDSECDCHHLW